MGVVCAFYPPEFILFQIFVNTIFGDSTLAFIICIYTHWRNTFISTVGFEKHFNGVFCVIHLCSNEKKSSGFWKPMTQADFWVQEGNLCPQQAAASFGYGRLESPPTIWCHIVIYSYLNLPRKLIQTSCDPLAGILRRYRIVQTNQNFLSILLKSEKTCDKGFQGANESDLSVD